MYKAQSGGVKRLRIYWFDCEVKKRKWLFDVVTQEKRENNNSIHQR